MMKPLSVKEISRLARISVRTLHYYDEIGLLKPSFRTDSGYRMYFEKDVILLQQISVLKAFQFSLDDINKILSKRINPLKHLILQKELLKSQIVHLEEVLQLIDECISEAEANSKISLSSLFKSIQGLHMIKDLKHTWAGKIFTDDELKDFAAMASAIPESEQIAYGKKWELLIAKVTQQMPHVTPESKEGIALATEWMNLVNAWYGDKLHLRNTLWDAYKTGKIDHQNPDVIDFPHISKEMAEWIDRAVKAGKLY